ncbi:hypothetical protein SAMN05421679_101315 [Epilithonimonas pallida]|uniref:Uncharacterized protein n=1 Tax=Epilithonimonas pallida TaxID=373671 RepID=A0ABY1QY37_9FLAO|nr:hypothetical protein SAMN05421679_101315 [Epilithonimonas pallida]
MYGKSFSEFLNKLVINTISILKVNINNYLI